MVVNTQLRKIVRADGGWNLKMKKTLIQALLGCEMENLVGLMGTWKQEGTPCALKAVDLRAPVRN